MSLNLYLHVGGDASMDLSAMSPGSSQRGNSAGVRSNG